MTPVRHLTARALAVFADQPDHPPPGVRVCGASSEEHATTAGAALLLGLTDATRPTCPACCVLLDAALEGRHE